MYVANYRVCVCVCVCVYIMFSPTPPDIGQCEAVYDYSANQSDELSLQPGDVINLIDKQDQDWWHGELHGQIGMFPASYVQEK